MKCVYSLLLTLFVCSCFAQTTYQPDLRKRPTIVGHISSFDFQTPSEIIATSLGDARWRGLGDNYSGLGLSFWTGITDKIDVSGSVNGTKMFYAFRDGIGGGSRKLLLEADASANFKLFADDHLVVPYLSLGIGGYNWGGDRTGMFAPLGTGIQVNIKDKVFLMTSFQYRLPVTKEANYHFLYNFSVGIPLTKKRPPKAVINTTGNVPTLVRTAVTDTDGDGIADKDDKCPTVFGSAEYRGCPPPPDRDKDGVADSLDECPDVPGLISYRGCPLPDSDKDSIPDFIDKCPDVPGLQRYEGCPIPDTDGDGVNDELDKCPNEKGPATNNGCPLPGVLKPGAVTSSKNGKTSKADTTGKKQQSKVLTTYEIFFYSGITIMPQTANVTLNGIINLMTKNPDLKAEIIGNADKLEFGSDDKANARERAMAVYRYLTLRGIKKERLTIISEGASKPKATNETMVGRSQNRRVDIKVIEN